MSGSQNKARGEALQHQGVLIIIKVRPNLDKILMVHSPQQQQLLPQDYHFGQLRFVLARLGELTKIVQINML